LFKDAQQLWKRNRLKFFAVTGTSEEFIALDDQSTIIDFRRDFEDANKKISKAKKETKRKKIGIKIPMKNKNLPPDDLL
jgi:hypothetical protein